MFISTPALTAHCPSISLAAHLSTQVRITPNINIFYPFTYVITHRVFHELWTHLYGIISLGFVTKNVGINKCLILFSYGAEGVLSFS
jgi:hypothetical protein